jgi:hypothetical protein
MSAQPTVIGSHDSLPSSFSYIKDLSMSQVGTFEGIGLSSVQQVHDSAWLPASSSSWTVPRLKLFL